MAVIEAVAVVLAIEEGLTLREALRVALRESEFVGEAVTVGAAWHTLAVAGHRGWPDCSVYWHRTSPLGHLTTLGEGDALVICEHE